MGNSGLILLDRADFALTTPDPITGKTFDPVLALDEVLRMVDEARGTVLCRMANIPPSVVEVLRLYGMAIESLTVAVRALQRK